MEKNKICLLVHGIPGSANTLIIRASRFMGIFKIMSSHMLTKNLRHTHIIIPIRDFRDNLATYMRRNLLQFSEENIQNSFKKIEKWHEQIEETISFFQTKNLLILKYEKFYNDFDYLIKELTEFFGIKTTNEQIERINNKCSLVAHRLISEKFENFGQYDKRTGIHGLHIDTGKAGSWRNFFPNTYHELINNLFEPYLTKWEFEI